MASVTFNNQKNLFFRSLKEKVDQYFSSQNMNTSGGRKLFVKGILQLCSAAILYTALVFFTLPLAISIVLCCLFGMNLALIGFNIMHEGGHQSFSKHAWINKAGIYVLNAMGGNSYYWKIKHNISHHTYTNVEGFDSDINLGFFMRLHKGQKHYILHRFQHIYWVVLYGLEYANWVLWDDFMRYFSGNISSTHTHQKLSLKEHLIFWLTKLFYGAIYIMLPILMVGLLKALIGFAIVCFVCGMFITVVFQIAHIVENTQFPAVNESTNKIEEQWAIHQVNTTSNFATGNRFISWLMGGLNFQVEHHLFPKISHIHYPMINRLVKETCLEFNIAYHEYPTMRKAFWSHLMHIKKMGRK